MLRFILQAVVTALGLWLAAWLIPGVEEARSLLGADYWSYGLEPNEKTLATFLRYHHEQGLSRRLREPAELFAPESAERFGS